MPISASQMNTQRWHTRITQPSTNSSSLLQHLFWGPIGGGFEACRSMPQHTEDCFGTFWGNHLSEIDGTLVLKWCICE